MEGRDGCERQVAFSLFTVHVFLNCFSLTGTGRYFEQMHPCTINPNKNGGKRTCNLWTHVATRPIWTQEQATKEIGSCLTKCLLKPDYSLSVRYHTISQYNEFILQCRLDVSYHNVIAVIIYHFLYICAYQFCKCYASVMLMAAFTISCTEWFQNRKKRGTNISSLL